ncbi:MAG: HNH endonuclease [Oscillospiraceae bacterium]|nr:HNH endonuclease [Oscillospiraceae bacterium]
MPYKSKRRCKFQGCPVLVEAGEGYCPQHKSAKFPARRSGEKSHYNRRWQKIRAVYLSKQPLCADCEKAGKLKPATEVHHIISIADGGSDSHENLMGLCKSCHSRRTAKETGFGNQI